jgi:hypothetical protein
MRLGKDLREFIESLNFHRVEYLIVGAHALAYHGSPRYTGDLDILIRPSADNANRLEGAIRKFGFGSLGLGADDFSEPYQVIQLGHPRVAQAIEKLGLKLESRKVPVDGLVVDGASKTPTAN